MVSKDIENLRNSTAEIIAQNPADIVLHREVITTGTDEEEIRTPEILLAQRMRIAEISNSQTDSLMEQGNIPTHIVNITAFHDADVLDKDRFNYLGKNYEIVFIRPVSMFGQDEDFIYKRSGRAREITEIV